MVLLFVHRLTTIDVVALFDVEAKSLNHPFSGSLPDDVTVIESLFRLEQDINDTPITDTGVNYGKIGQNIGDLTRITGRLGGL